MSRDRACPECGSSERLMTVEHLIGHAPVTVDGDGEAVWEGTTDVLWDLMETAGVRCGGCHWFYDGEDWMDQLTRGAG